MRTDLTQPDSHAHLKSERAVVTARRLRRNATPAEKALWIELRRVSLEGSHFRRQAPFGPFIVDFLCHKARLVVELDGGVHQAPDVALRDLERQAWIEARGYRMLRIANRRVLSDVRAVTVEIACEAEARIRVGVKDWRKLASG